MNTSIVAGSLSAIATQTGRTIAETFLNADVIVIVDTSGSMDTKDSRGGKTRYTVACEELKNLQASLPGKIAVINFSSDVRFEPGGYPLLMSGGTNLEKALKFVKIADIPGMKFILISDGQPDDPEGALRVAKTFQCHIDVIYVGDEKYPTGRAFLEQLAAATGGQTVTADKAKELQPAVMQLLGAGN